MRPHEAPAGVADSLRDARTREGPVILQPRWALSWLRGLMTRAELLLARSSRPPGASLAQPSAA